MNDGKKINKNDFKIIITTGTGQGGQHKNRVSTAVIITHLPTGLQEKCEDTRSQSRNKEIAMKRLLSKIKELENNKKHEKINDLRKNQINGKPIRTYNYPRNQVKDHRTGKRANLDKIMKGNLDSLK